MQNAMVRMLTTLGLTLVLICSIAFAPAKARAFSDDQTAGWTFDVMPLYLWFPEIVGDLTVRGQSDTLDVSVIEWGELMAEDARFAFTSRVHARKDRLLFTLDLLAVSIEQDEEFLEVLRRDSTFTEIMLEFGVGYHVGTLHHPTYGSSIALDAVVGGRYQHIDAEADLISPTLTLGFDQTVDWLEPFIGAMITFTITEKLGFFVGGNVGGFGVGSDLTWTITSIVYLSNLWRNVTFFIGYRVMDIDYSEGSGRDEFEYDVQMRGPGFGFNLRF